MPIKGTGWEFHLVRKSEQRRHSDGKIRTVGMYQIFHDGVKAKGPHMSGMTAETRGDSNNSDNNDKAGNGRRIEAGTYPLATQAGTKYVTHGYSKSLSPRVYPKPGIEVMNTGKRQEILIHPGIGFLASIGCINPCKSLPLAGEPIDYVPSRARVIEIIEDLKAYLGADFPKKNGHPIPRAWLVVDGEPTLK
jgi:hypothetical protein